jgi:hypothetical protein
MTVTWADEQVPPMVPNHSFTHFETRNKIEIESMGLTVLSVVEVPIGVL